MIRGLVIGDTHCGSVTGLTPPQYWTAETRAWLEPAWAFWNAVLDQIGPVDFLVANGDLVDGPGRRDTTAHLETDVTKQADMAAEIIDMVRAKNKYIIRGTGYHTDNGGSLETFVGGALGIDVTDDLRLEAGGRKLHFRHVVGRSDIPYGQYTQLGKELINDVLRGEFEAYPAADVLVRSHVHYSAIVGVDDGVRGLTRWAMSCPGLQLMGPVVSSFVRGLRTWLYHFGVRLIEIDPKTKEVFPRVFLLPQKDYMAESRRYKCLTE